MWRNYPECNIDEKPESIKDFKKKENKRKGKAVSLRAELSEIKSIRTQNILLKVLREYDSQPKIVYFSKSISQE